MVRLLNFFSGGGDVSKITPEGANLQWMQTQIVSLRITRAAPTKMSCKKMFHGLCLVYFIFWGLHLQTRRKFSDFPD